MSLPILLKTKQPKSVSMSDFYDQIEQEFIEGKNPVVPVGIAVIWDTTESLEGH